MDNTIRQNLPQRTPGIPHLRDHRADKRRRQARGVPRRPGGPVARFEAERIEWIPLDEIPELIAGGQIHAAITAASLLYLLQRRL